MELEGKSLSFWLQELVCEDSERRTVAAPLLSRFDDGFKAAVQATLSEPDFPRIEWLNQLFDFLFWARHSRAETSQKAYTPENHDWENFLSLEMTASWVLSAAGEHLLWVPERVCQMLDDRQWHGDASKLLRDLGTRAAPVFAEALWSRWYADLRQDVYTMAAVLRESPEYIRRVGACLGPEHSPEHRMLALRTLSEMGEAALGLVPKRFSCVQEWLDDPVLWRDAIGFLAFWTQGKEPPTAYLLELSYSDDIWRKKAALEALGSAARDSERVVPRLIAAFDDYQEPDSDAYWHSSHLVITEALCAFGPAAAPAIPALMARLTMGNEIDYGVWRCLGSIGEPVLPWLEELADTTLEEAEATGNGFVCEATVLRLRQLRDHR